jgi:hypothetical protein
MLHGFLITQEEGNTPAHACVRQWLDHTSTPTQCCSCCRCVTTAELQTCCLCCLLAMQLDAVSRLVLGTEDCRVLILNAAGTAVDKSVVLPAVPAFLATTG